MMIENPVVSPPVSSRLKLLISVVPDKKLKSENPTMILSEYKKARDILDIAIPPMSILRILGSDRYMLSSSDK